MAKESMKAREVKPAAYALILLRQTGLPCVFYGDYYGISGEFAQESFKDVIDRLLLLRQTVVYGEEVDYFDEENCIGWTCLGDDQHPNPLAVVISNGKATSKHLFVGENWVGQAFEDALYHYPLPVTIDADGYGDFPVGEKSVSAWVPLGVL